MDRRNNPIKNDSFEIKLNDNSKRKMYTNSEGKATIHISYNESNNFYWAFYHKIDSVSFNPNTEIDLLRIQLNKIYEQ